VIPILAHLFDHVHLSIVRWGGRPRPHTPWSGC
jgi:hypothetical protein